MLHKICSNFQEVLIGLKKLGVWKPADVTIHDSLTEEIIFGKEMLDSKKVK